MQSILLQVLLRRIRLVFVPSPVVELHPVVFPILNFPGVLERLGQEVSQVIVVGSVFKTEVADVCQVLGEFFYA